MNTPWPTTVALYHRAAAPEQFVELLHELGELLGGLLAVAERKLAALRAADAATLQSCALDEHRLLQRMVVNQQQRATFVARLAQERRLAPADLICLSTIAAQLPEPQASAIRARALGLQRAAEQLRERNHLAGDVARRLQEHVRSIFAGLAGALQESCGYGPDGQTEATTARRVVDAVG